MTAALSMHDITRTSSRKRKSERENSENTREDAQAAEKKSLRGTQEVNTLTLRCPRCKVVGSLRALQLNACERVWLCITPKCIFPLDSDDLSCFIDPHSLDERRTVPHESQESTPARSQIQGLTPAPAPAPAAPVVKMAQRPPGMRSDASEHAHSADARRAASTGNASPVHPTTLLAMLCRANASPSSPTPCPRAHTDHSTAAAASAATARPVAPGASSEFVIRACIAAPERRSGKPTMDATGDSASDSTTSDSTGSDSDCAALPNVRVVGGTLNLSGCSLRIRVPLATAASEGDRASCPTTPAAPDELQVLDDDLQALDVALGGLTAESQILPVH